MTQISALSPATATAFGDAGAARPDASGGAAFAGFLSAGEGSGPSGDRGPEGAERRHEGACQGAGAAALGAAGAPKATAGTSGAPPADFAAGATVPSGSAPGPAIGPRLFGGPTDDDTDASEEASGKASLETPPPWPAGAEGDAVVPAPPVLPDPARGGPPPAGRSAFGFDMAPGSGAMPAGDAPVAGATGPTSRIGTAPEGPAGRRSLHGLAPAERTDGPAPGPRGSGWGDTRPPAGDGASATAGSGGAVSGEAGCSDASSGEGSGPAPTAPSPSAAGASPGAAAHAPDQDGRGLVPASAIALPPGEGSVEAGPAGHAPGQGVRRTGAAATGGDLPAPREAGVPVADAAARIVGGAANVAVSLSVSDGTAVGAHRAGKEVEGTVVPTPAPSNTLTETANEAAARVASPGGFPASAATAQAPDAAPAGASPVGPSPGMPPDPAPAKVEPQAGAQTAGHGGAHAGGQAGGQTGSQTGGQTQDRAQDQTALTASQTANETGAQTSKHTGTQPGTQTGGGRSAAGPEAPMPSGPGLPTPASPATEAHAHRDRTHGEGRGRAGDRALDPAHAAGGTTAPGTGPAATADGAAVPPPDTAPAPGDLSAPAQVALQPAPSGGTAAPERLPAQPHGGPAQLHDVARQIAAAVTAHPDRVVELALSPEELGPVRMSMTAADGAVTLAVTAERPETLDLLRRGAESLERQFREMGFQTVSFSFGSGGGPADRRDRWRDGSGPPRPGRDAEDRTALAAVAATALRPPAAMAHGRLDLRI